ncbi:MAG: hypothetical protein ABI650_00210 [Dokdonella sp.]
MNAPMHSHDPKVKAALDVLEGMVAHLVSENPDEDVFWPVFTREADAIVAAAPAEDRPYARGRIDCMLKNAGMIRGEDEGEPCA